MASAAKRKSVTNAVPVKKVLKTEVKREKEDFEDDLRAAQKETLFSCEVCNATFVTQMSLTRHMVYHEDLPKFPCNFCKKVFYKTENLASHITVDHGGAKFACKYCNRNLSRRDHLMRHITNVHPEFLLEAMKNEAPDTEVKPPVVVKKEKTPQPPIQSAKSLNSKPPQPRTAIAVNTHSELNGEDPNDLIDYSEGEDEDPDEDVPGGRHLQLNMTYPFETNLNYEGMESNEDYDDITKINASLNGIRVERKHQCAECGASFMSSVNLQRHLATHSADRPHKCPMCGKGFVRKEHLTKHLSSVHSGMKFTCEFCGKDISRKDHLIRHIRNVHPTEYLGIPPEILENQNLDLSVALATFSNPEHNQMISERALKSMQPKPKKPYLACDMCDEEFTQLHDLHEHQSVVHSDVRKFRCDYCPKAFKRKEHLLKHHVLHTGEKNFCCDNCGKEFPRKDALQDHIRRIHGVDNTSGNEYPCNFCEKVFLQRSNLIRHMRGAHDLMIDLDGEESDDQFEGEIGGGMNISVVNNSPGTSSSIVVNPIPYTGNGNGSSQGLSLREEVSFFQNSLQSFSCAHCKAEFNDEKRFIAHLNSHKKQQTSLFSK